MKTNRQIRLMVIVNLITIPLLLSGCSLFGTRSSAQIDPPPAEIESQMLQSIESVDKTSLKFDDEVSTVYLRDENDWLAPVALHLPQDDTRNKHSRMLEMLVKDGPYSSYIPSGFMAVLPKGTEVKAVTVKQDEQLAIVEFNAAFGQYQAVDERKLLEAVTWTLASDPEIKNVQIWMDGAKLNEMPVNGTPLDRPLNRSIGINLELSEGTHLSGSRGVTVFFSSSTSDGVQYFVPVTRFVSAQISPVTAAISELIKGPSNKSGLERVLTDLSVLKSVELSEDGVVTVSIEDEMFDIGEKPPAQMMQSIVLTVTENSADHKVRIWLNGEKDVIGMDDQKYGEPVMRPEVINEIPI